MSNKNKKNKPKIHDDLKGFNIHIDEFGQVRTTMSQEDLNSFLNEKVVDKKFSPKVRAQLEKLYTDNIGEEE